MSRQQENPLHAAIARLFTPELPPGRFLLNVTLLSLSALTLAVTVYVALIPGMAGHLASSGAAGGRFLRQILTNGLPVVLAVNVASLLLFARLGAGALTVVHWAALDLLARIGLFILLHAAIFAGSALVFGSFGGNSAQALRVVAPTLLQAASFGNLSGAYLYAALLCALPLHVAALSVEQWPPRPTVLALAVLLALCNALLLTAIAAALNLLA